MGKLRKLESSIDRISGLPDSILTHILSFLPTKCAVRTCILSTRWKYLYTSVTSLDFDDYYHVSSDVFMNFVDKVLFSLDTTYIESFRLVCDGVEEDAYAYRICGWISFALQRHVQELHLHIMSGRGEVPSDFVDGDSIRRLVSGCLVLEELAIVYFPSQDVSEINISSPSLKRLTMKCDIDCDAGPDGPDVYPNIVIDAPSLVNLEFTSVLAGSCLIVNLHSLVKADLKDLFDFEGFSLQFATNLLKGISNIQSLSVSPDFLMLFTLCDKPLTVFSNLVCVEIGVDDSDDLYEDFEMTDFLESSPNLEILIFAEGIFESVTLNPSKRVPPCLLSHLKVIEIYSFGGQMKPVEYFLKNASVLEKVKIQMDKELQVEKRHKITKKLLMLPRESKICQVEIV
ncbi:hypothetical protein PTKIN_Ptkin06aG0162700 [Pterospermum kingtungense]